MARRKSSITNTDQILVYGIAGVLVVGAIGILMGIGKKGEEGTGGLAIPEAPKQAMAGKTSGCGCGM